MPILKWGLPFLYVDRGQNYVSDTKKFAATGFEPWTSRFEVQGSTTTPQEHYMKKISKVVKSLS